MEVKIYYCNLWNYKPQAARVAEEIQNEFKDAQISTIEKGGGHFIVEVDGKIIYSKKDLFNCEVDRFPHEGEITKLMKQM